MSTLGAIFKLYDGYSTTIQKVTKNTDQATNKILKASGATDNFSNKLKNVGASASTASGGLGKLVKMALSVATAFKGISIADSYTNTNTRIGLLTDSMEKQLELQNQIFAAAERSKGSYSSMADVVAKMGILAKDNFSSNSEIVAFTELLQKSFKISGASTSEQQSALLQLSQAMAAGKLQGDEFRSIMENAPMLASAIAEYTGKTKGELKTMSAEGTITADIIKNALFSAADDINGKFEQMPYTFADIWNKIKNNATKAFAPVIKKVNEMINTEEFKNFIDGLSNGFTTMANVASSALDGIANIYNFIKNNWSNIVPIIEAAAAAWLAYKSALLLVKAAQWALNLASLANPITLVITLVALLAAAFVLLWEKSEKFRKIIVSMWKASTKATALAFNNTILIYNKFVDLKNRAVITLKSFLYTVKLVMQSVVTLTKNGALALVDYFSTFIDMIGNAVNAYNAFAKATGGKTIDFNFSSKNIKAGIEATANVTSKAIDDSYNNLNNLLSGMISSKKDLLDMDKLFNNVDTFGNALENFSVTDWIKKKLDDITDILGNNPYDDTPIIVEGTGSGGNVNVNMSDDDMKYLRDIAERDYINQFKTSTLAPNINVQFGDVRETADVNKVASVLTTLLQEQIAISAEGVY